MFTKSTTFQRINLSSSSSGGEERWGTHQKVPAAKTGLSVTAASTTNTIGSPSDDGDTCSLQNLIILINILDGEFTKCNSIHNHQDALNWLYFLCLFCFSPFGKSVYRITMKSHNEGTAASDAKYSTLQKFLQHKCLLSKDHVVTSSLTSPI